MASSVNEGYTTMRFTVTLAEDQSNVYAIYSDAGAEMSIPPPVDPMSLLPGWREIESAEGNYFFNDTTGESQWDAPVSGGASVAE